MDALSLQSLADYWSLPVVATNVVIFFNLLGALILGLLVGYERAYHGRAAGMRTYGLVCMASAAVTVIFGSPLLWFGGHTTLTASPDPSHVVQGILTGIGFLGAGVIMREGLHIRGAHDRGLDLVIVGDWCLGGYRILWGSDIAHRTVCHLHDLGVAARTLVAIARGSSDRSAL